MNKNEKQKTILIVAAIIIILLGVAALIGGIVMMVSNANQLAKTDEKLALNIIMIILGALLGIFGLFGLSFGFYWAIVGGAVKATNGSIAETNLGVGTVNGNKCPKCGCTNTPDAIKCGNCGTSFIEEITSEK